MKADFELSFNGVFFSAHLEEKSPSEQRIEQMDSASGEVVFTIDDTSELDAFIRQFEGDPSYRVTVSSLGYSATIEWVSPWVMIEPVQDRKTKKGRTIRSRDEYHLTFELV